MVLVVVGAMIGSAAFVPGVVATNHTDPPPSDQVVHVQGDVSAWERAPFPLRADLTNASWTVPNALLTLQDNEGNTRDLGKDPVGVYPTDSVVRLTFDDARASFDGGLEDREVTVVAARLSDDATVPDVTTVDGAIDLLTGPNVNQNATFEVVERTTLDDGATTVTHQPDRSGQYLYFAATHEDGRDGFSVDDGNFSIDGEVTVIGIENVVVEDTAGSVSPPTRTIPAGNDATVNVDSNLEDADRVAHAFVLYDEETFIRQQFTVTQEAELDGDFDPSEDVTVRTTVASVNGEGRVDTSVSVLGVSIDDGRSSGTLGVGEIVAFLAGRLSADEPTTEIDGETELDASAVVFEDDADPDPFRVTTFENWSAGEYRWIYVAQDTNSTRLSTDTGTFRVVERGGGDRGRSGDGSSDTSASASTGSWNNRSVNTSDDGDGEGEQSGASDDGDQSNAGADDEGGSDQNAGSDGDDGDEGSDDGATDGTDDDGAGAGQNVGDAGPVQSLAAAIGGNSSVVVGLVAAVVLLTGLAVYRRRL